MHKIWHVPHFGFDTGIYRVSQHGQDDLPVDPEYVMDLAYDYWEQLTDPAHVQIDDYGSTDGVTDRLGGGMASVGLDTCSHGKLLDTCSHGKCGKLKL